MFRNNVINKNCIHTANTFYFILKKVSTSHTELIMSHEVISKIVICTNTSYIDYDTIISNLHKPYAKILFIRVYKQFKYSLKHQLIFVKKNKKLCKS